MWFRLVTTAYIMIGSSVFVQYFGLTRLHKLALALKTLLECTGLWVAQGCLNWIFSCTDNYCTDFCLKNRGMFSQWYDPWSVYRLHLLLTWRILDSFRRISSAVGLIHTHLEVHLTVDYWCNVVHLRIQNRIIHMFPYCSCSISAMGQFWLITVFSLWISSLISPIITMLSC